MSNHIYRCDICGRTFNLVNGDGWGESYFNPGAMLPSTRYVCNQCINKRKDALDENETI